MRAFLKKELKEILKTYRLWAVPVVFLFMGLSAPATTKFLPEMLKPQLQAQGISITLPKLGAVGAYQAYFKNLTQIGLLAVILFSMSLVSEEKARGVLAQVVTKPIGRPDIVLAKWLVHGGWFVISLAIGAISCYFYTVGLFGKAPAAAFAGANFIFAVYILFIFSLTLAASAVLRSQVAASVVSLAGFSALSLLSFFSSWSARYSPASLNDHAVNLVLGRAGLVDAIWPMLVTVALGAALLAGGIFIFDRQEL